MEQKKTNKMGSRMNANLPALILVAVLLFTWQAAAMGIDAAYILPSPVQVVVRLWELRGPLFTAHLPGDDVGSRDWTFDLDCAGRGTGCADGCQ